MHRQAVENTGGVEHGSSCIPASSIADSLLGERTRTEAGLADFGDDGVPVPMIALLPSNETHRLRILRGYAILDTPAEARFDDITFLAAQICETPIALITLIDESR